jgi:predicted alpha-1,2-mannosidase
MLAGHEQEAYRVLRANALGRPPDGSRSVGRSGNDYYAKLGYIPTGVRCLATGTGGDCRRPASATLEYAAADGALAPMAAALGHAADARLLRSRAQNYRHLYDPRIGFFRPKDRHGTWLSPYNPVTGGDAFHEGNAYTYRWLAPQDLPGLVKLLGGPAATAKRLDAFFDYPELLRDPAGAARKAWVHSAYDYYTDTTYNPNNEPDLHAPFVYAWAGQPWKTADVVRAAQTLFTTGPEGMTGNDDLGTMSAWYVLTALGLYPVTSGSGQLSMTTPLFPQATLQIGSRTLSIDAPGVSDATHYISGVTLNGQPVSTTSIARSAIVRGGQLSFSVSAVP